MRAFDDAAILGLMLYLRDVLEARERIFAMLRQEQPHDVALDAAMPAEEFYVIRTADASIRLMMPADGAGHDGKSRFDAHRVARAFPRPRLMPLKSACRLQASQRRRRRRGG